MMQDPTTFAVAILFLGALAQWIAHQSRIPSILLLLLAGLALGKAGAGLIDPDKFLRPDQLAGFITLAVAVILFEGGLSLKLEELKDVGRPVLLLITLGVLISFAATTFVARNFLGLSLPVALVLGSILVVTGPTVIGPLLRDVKPQGRVATIVRWEGIVNDPIGVMLAVLVYEVVIAAGPTGSFSQAILVNLSKTLGIGFSLGVFGGLLLSLALRRHWIPDFLQGFLSLAFALLLCHASNVMQHESGLLTVTVLGIVLVSQHNLPLKPIIEFKENLGVLLISTLFLVLTARVPRSMLTMIDLSHVLFVVIMIVAIRPLSVFGALLPLRWPLKEMTFITWMAPRGIVAVALTSLFALKLKALGFQSAQWLEPVVFLVVLVTVSVYGLTAAPLARALGLSEKDPQGVLIMGAHAWAREIASSLVQAGYRAVLIDTNEVNVNLAKSEGLEAVHGDVIHHEVSEALDLAGIGRFLALTANDEANSLAALHMSEHFGRKESYQLIPQGDGCCQSAAMPRHLRGRLLFGRELTFKKISELMVEGATVGVVPAEGREHELPLFSFGARGLAPVSCDAPKPARAAAIGLRLPGAKPQSSRQPEADLALTS